MRTQEAGSVLYASAAVASSASVSFMKRRVWAAISACTAGYLNHDRSAMRAPLVSQPTAAPVWTASLAHRVVRCKARRLLHKKAVPWHRLPEAKFATKLAVQSSTTSTVQSDACFARVLRVQSAASLAAEAKVKPPTYTSR